MVHKPEGKRQLGRPSRRREDNIKGMWCMDRIDLVQNRETWQAFVYVTMTFRGP